MTRKNEAPEEISDSLFRVAQGGDREADAAGASRNESYWWSLGRHLVRNRTVMLCFAVMALLLTFSLIQPLLPGQRDPNLICNDPATGIQMANLKPCAEFLLGTNNLGQDMWARLWNGTRVSLLVGFAVALICTLLGAAFGMVWGYSERAGALLTEVYNVFDNIPSIIILLVISYMLRPGILGMIFAMCVTNWTSTARLIRNQTVIIKNSPYNQASRCLGTSMPRILAQNIAPRVLPVLLLQIARAVPAAIGNEVFLSYLGLGLPNDCPSLGQLVNAARGMVMTPSLRYQFYAPILILGIITVCFYFIGHFLGDYINPRSR